jgi:unsaturated chondroitin disaccharide hydrolase
MPDSIDAIRTEMLPRLQNALAFAGKQTLRLTSARPGYYPMYTRGGRWKQEGELWTHWCEGFLPGILWLLAKHTAEPTWRALAERYTTPLAPRRFDRAVHDLGFLFFSTYLRWYRLTNEPALEQILIDAGRTLALRRQNGGYLASFIGPQSLFIDIMMNVGIVLWAANRTNDESLRRIALDHCRTSQHTLVRADGSAAHEALFARETGKFLRQSTHQGLSGESAWARGQAWAIYGFAAVHRLTGPADDRDELLRTACRCADYYLSRLGPALVPPWDFDATDDGTTLLDSSAAAIAASGLWDLSEQVSSTELRDRYRLAAVRMLAELCSERFLPLERPEWEGILMHGVYHLPKGLGVDESVAWGDHFFVEGLIKAIAGRSEAAW